MEFAPNSCKQGLEEVISTTCTVWELSLFEIIFTLTLLPSPLMRRTFKSVDESLNSCVTTCMKALKACDHKNSFLWVYSHKVASFV